MRRCCARSARRKGSGSRHARHKPVYRAYQQNPEAVQRWREVEFPAIQKLARQEGAEIFFCDESGIRSDYHSGTTWAAMGQTPVVKSSGSRFSLNMVLAISAKGSLRFMVVEGGMNGERFIEFLKRLTHNAGRSIFLVVDGHPFHRATIVTRLGRGVDGGKVHRPRSYGPCPLSFDIARCGGGRGS